MTSRKFCHVTSFLAFGNLMTSRLSSTLKSYDVTSFLTFEIHCRSQSQLLSLQVTSTVVMQWRQNRMYPTCKDNQLYPICKDNQYTQYSMYNLFVPAQKHLTSKYAKTIVDEFQFNIEYMSPVSPVFHTLVTVSIGP